MMPIECSLRLTGCHGSFPEDDMMHLDENSERRQKRVDADSFLRCVDMPELLCKKGQCTQDEGVFDR